MNRYKVSGLIFIFLFSFLDLSAQDFLLKNISSDQVKIHPTDVDFSDFTRLVDYLPKDFVTDGSADYTVYIQQALDSHKKVIFPDFSLLINPKGLSVRSNSILYFEENSELVMAPNASERYEILRIHNQGNIKIFNPSLRGDRKAHRGKKGQWGMGIAIRGSSNIEVVNPQISDCWGDGIYIGQLADTDSYHVTIRGGFLNNNRRNGASITSGTSITIEDILISNTNGHSPQSGIDLEPNNIRCNIADITLKNIVTFNNAAYGIVVSLHKFYNHRKTIGISVENHTDTYSRYGFSIFEPKSPSVGKTIDGYVNLINGNYSHNKLSPFKYAKHNFSFRLNIVKPDFRVKSAKGHYEDRSKFFINKLESVSRNRKALSVEF